MKSLRFCNRTPVAGFLAPVPICYVSHRSSTYRLPPPKHFLCSSFKSQQKSPINPLAPPPRPNTGLRQISQLSFCSYRSPKPQSHLEFFSRKPALVYLYSLMQSPIDHKDFLLQLPFHQLISLPQSSSPTGILWNTADEQVN